jgi:hypothetical protein
MNMICATTSGGWLDPIIPFQFNCSNKNRLALDILCSERRGVHIDLEAFLVDVL